MPERAHEDILRDRLQALVEAVQSTVYIPERNCSCHRVPPCKDCVEWSMLREAMDEAKAAIAPANAPPPVPPEPIHKCPRCQAHTRLVCGAGADCGNSPRELPAFPVNQQDEE